MTAILLSFADAYRAVHGPEAEQKRRISAACGQAMNRAEIERRAGWPKSAAELSLSGPTSTSCSTLAIAGAELAEAPAPGPWSEI